MGLARKQAHALARRSSETFCFVQPRVTSCHVTDSNTVLYEAKDISERLRDSLGCKDRCANINFLTYSLTYVHPVSELTTRLENGASHINEYD